jgi:Sulfotransferase family
VSAFEVLEITISPQAREELVDLSLERPQAGATGEELVLPLAGWVLARGEQPQRIEIRSGPRLIKTALLQRPLAAVARTSPEVRERHPDLPEDLPCGFVTLVGVLGLPPEFELELRAVLAGERTVPIATVRARHEPLRPPFEPTLQPLLVTAPPRSGTTWLMKVLAGHPQVVVHDVHPYEIWPAKYWTHALKVLTDPADHVNSTKPFALDARQFEIGHNPFFTPRIAQQPELAGWLGRANVERMAAFVLEMIDEWYLTLARVQGVESPRYFAEKQMFRHEVSPVLMWELYPRAKEIFVVRDFRDLACSHLSFSRDPETGEPRGKLVGKSNEQYVREGVRAIAVDFRDAWRARRDRAHLMRYEDLVLRPDDVLPELLTYLELEDGPEVVRSMLDAEIAVSTHMTSPDAARSIGRWRREDPAMQALCSEVFADLLEEFGYEAAVPSRTAT